jgi:hypothetical protein
MMVLLETRRDPVWQILAAVIVVAAPLLVVALRTGDVFASAQQMRRRTRLVLVVCLAAFVVMSGGEVLLHMQQAPALQTGTASPAAALTSPATTAPGLTPAASLGPAPTPTPRLARSITQVLLTFCDALNRRDYQTAWQQYATVLQHRRPEADVVAAWQRVTRCRVPEQSADPAAWTVLTLTLAPGVTDQIGRGGDIDYRFTMGVEDNRWKITGICDIIAEGCFPTSELG